MSFSKNSSIYILLLLPSEIIEKFEPCYFLQKKERKTQRHMLCGVRIFDQKIGESLWLQQSEDTKPKRNQS
eukprot:UN00639